MDLRKALKEDRLVRNPILYPDSKDQLFPKKNKTMNNFYNQRFDFSSSNKFNTSKIFQKNHNDVQSNKKKQSQKENSSIKNKS